MTFTLTQLLGAVLLALLLGGWLGLAVGAREARARHAATLAATPVAPAVDLRAPPRTIREGFLPFARALVDHVFLAGAAEAADRPMDAWLADRLRHRARAILEAQAEATTHALGRAYARGLEDLREGLARVVDVPVDILDAAAEQAMRAADRAGPGADAARFRPQRRGNL